METDLKALEAKLAQLIAMCQSMRSENIELRQALAQAHDDSKQLRDKMSMASSRLEALLQKLPEESL